MVYIILWGGNVHAQIQFPCQKDLVPFPTNDHAIVLFKKISNGTMDQPSGSNQTGNAYQKVADTFCSGFFNGSGQITGGTVVGTDLQGGQVRELTITLPSFNWGVLFNSSVTLSASNISCTLKQSSTLKQSLNGVTVTKATQFASNAKTATYTGRGQRTVYMLTGESNTACWVRTVNANGTVPPGATDEANYTVKVNTGTPPFSECNSANNAGSNNSKTYSYLGSISRVGDQNNSIEAVDQLLEIQVFPNPAENEINLKIESDKPNFNIQIVNIEGKTVLQKQMSNENEIFQNTIDISQLTAGMYMMRVSDQKDISTKRFIKN